MTGFTLSPFFAALVADGIRPTIRDYERISLALQARGEWTLTRLRDVLLALLAKNEEQQALFMRRFDNFFKLSSEAEKKFAEVDVQRVLAELRQLAEAPSTIPPLRGARGVSSIITAASLPQRKLKWAAAFAVLTILSLSLWYLLQPKAQRGTPLVQLDALLLLFPNQHVDSSGTTSKVTLKNIGSQPLLIDTMSIAPPHDFHLLGEYNKQLAPRDSLPIHVHFKPTASGLRSAILEIKHNAPDSLHRIVLRGTGIGNESSEPPPPERQRLYTNVPYVKEIRYSPLESSTAWKTSASIAAALLVLSLLYGYYLWQLRKIPEDQPPKWNKDGPRLFSLGAIGGKPAPRLDNDTLDQLAEAMGYFQSEQPSAFLDVPASIAATGKNGGMPALEFHRRKQVRSLLVLEDAFSEAAAWNPIAQELAAGMAQRGVEVLHGKFHGAPEHFKTNAGSELRLEDLEDQRAGYILLLFSDGKSLDRHKSGFALEALKRWPMVAWMELRERRFWDETSALPVRHGLPIYYANAAGLLQAVRRFLTEAGAQEDCSAGADQWQGLPAHANLQASVEQILGEALPWAQDCALFQPMSLGLAEALRHKFHAHVPGEHAARLLALPNTARNVSGFRFSNDALKVLRHGFLQRRTEAEQQAVLRFILQQLEASQPAEKDSPAYLAWEAKKERLRLELEEDNDLQRLAQLAHQDSPLREAIGSELEHFGFANETEKIPLRVKPRNRHALQRLARMKDGLQIAKLEKYPVAWGHRVALLALFAGSLFCVGLSLSQYLERDPKVENWRFVTSDNQPFQFVEIASTTGDPSQTRAWQTEQPYSMIMEYERTAHTAQRDTFHLKLYGNGANTDTSFTLDKDSVTTLVVDQKDLLRPCREEYLGGGLIVQRCPEDDQTIPPLRGARGVSRIPTWKDRLGEQAPKDRRLSVGLELTTGELSESELLRALRDTLLHTSSVDVIYRVIFQPEREAADSTFADAAQKLKRDLGPMLAYGQLLWWGDALPDQMKELRAQTFSIDLANPLWSIDRVLDVGNLDDTEWISTLSNLLAPGDSVLVTEAEILRALQLERATGSGEPIALVRPLRVGAKPQPTRPDSTITTTTAKPESGFVTITLPAAAETFVPALFFSSANTTFAHRFAPQDLQRGVTGAEQDVRARYYRLQQKLPVSRWLVAAQAPGYRDTSLAVLVQANETQAISLELQPVAQQLASAKPNAPPPGMVLIPAGRFLMGDDNGASNEKPAHIVSVQAFYLDQTEVTVAQYAAFVQATKHDEPPDWQGQLKHPQFPVVNVSWHDATAYCEWLSKARGQRVRLPTEAEWEYAARGFHTGVDGKAHYQYPWGDEIDSTKANYSDKLRKVASYPAYGYNLYDMSGNVWEWCADWYDENYYQTFKGRIADNPKGPTQGDSRLLRGGSWYYYPQGIRCAYRGRVDPTLRSDGIGFRCAQDAF